MKVLVETIGCRLNRSEIEQYAVEFQSAGHEIVQHPERADIAIVNTCAVTQAAVRGSRQKSRSLAADGVRKIVLTGCWASLDPGQAGQLPRVSKVVDNLSKDGLVASLLAAERPLYESEPIARTPLPGVQRGTRAFIKVQDGCDQRCTFCVTTVARGPSRSLPADLVLERIDAAHRAGHKEAVLSGVQIGAWGYDLEPRMRLEHLLRLVLEDTEMPRIRLSSLEPWACSAELVSLWQDPRMCPHLHLPLQSGSPATLRRMKRRTGPETYARLLDNAREQIPGLAVTTDVIVGFPGEGEREFEESLSFIDRMAFSGGHVFAYSARPGTRAAEHPDPVPHNVRSIRSRVMRDQLEASASRYLQTLLGSTVEVLWEAVSQRDKEGWRLEGWAGEYVRVRAHAPELRVNVIDRVKLTSLQQDAVSGQISTNDG